MTTQEVIDMLVEQDAKTSEALVMATEVIGDLVDRVIKLEEKVYGSNS